MKEFTKSELETLKAIGKRLRELRIEKGYAGYEHFAWEHKIPRSSYLKMEQGKNYHLISLVRVLAIHGVKFEEFFKNSGF